MTESKKTMKQQTTFITLSIILVAMMIFFASNAGKGTPNSPKNTDTDTGVTPVQIVDGVQIIEVTARGGYNPREIIAKAGVPTVLRMKTSGTFDCSSAFVIPSLGIQKMLPATGVTNFDIPIQESGASIKATCSMGMYNLQINFQ
jgi:plastocyanin domain-containing protein